MYYKRVLRNNLWSQGLELGTGGIIVYLISNALVGSIIVRFWDSTATGDVWVLQIRQLRTGTSG